MNQAPGDTPRIDDLRGQVTALREALRRLEEQQGRLARRRRRHLLTVGVGVSLVVHLGLLYYLALMYRPGPPARGSQPVSYEFAIVQEQELTRIEALELEDLLPDLDREVQDVPDDEPAADLDPAAPAADLEIAGAGALPTLAGSGTGSGADGTIGGGGAGTTFFGVRSRGRRFAYIVDRSGSMGELRKLPIALGELARSVESLPDFASFYVLLFSSQYVQPPMQRGWMRARRPAVNRFIRWLNEIDQQGGTVPLPAFQQVFALDPLPDVIFFLTDGQIPDDTAGRVAELNGSRRGRVTINTIAFGDPSSQDQLRRIARESGGVYRFVATEAR